MNVGKQVVVLMMSFLLTACTLNPSSIRDAPIEPMPWELTAAAQRNPEAWVSVATVEARGPTKLWEIDTCDYWLEPDGLQVSPGGSILSYPCQIPTYVSEKQDLTEYYSLPDGKLLFSFDSIFM